MGWCCFTAKSPNAKFLLFATVDGVVAGMAGDGLYLRRIAAAAVAHAGLDGVAGLGQGARGEGTETAGGAGDQNGMIPGYLQKGKLGLGLGLRIRRSRR